MEREDALKKKLMQIRAIAEGATNPNECAVALTKFQRLLQKYSLSEAEIAEEKEQNPDGLITQVEVKNASHNVTWVQLLHSVNAIHYRCEPLRIRTERGTVIYRIVGLSKDVEIAKYAFDTTYEVANRMAKEYKAAHPGASRQDFLRGFVTGLDRAYSEQEKTNPQIGALITNQPKEIAEFINRNKAARRKPVHCMLTSGITTNDTTKDGYNAGYNVGRGDTLPEAENGKSEKNPNGTAE